MNAPIALRPDPSTVPASMTSYQLMMAAGLAPLTVKCDTCGEPAGSGYYCRSKSGYTTPIHAARKAAVAHLTEDEQVAAFAAMRAEEKRRRDESSARQAERNADPAYITERDRKRAAWNAAFAQVDADQRAHEAQRRSECRDMWVHADDCMCADPTWVRPAPPVLDIGRRDVTDLSAVRAKRGAS